MSRRPERPVSADHSATRRDQTGPRVAARRDSAVAHPPRAAIVTGAGSGIGLALATALAKRGDLVTLADIDADAVTTAAANLPGATAAVVDVRDAAAVADLAVEVVARHGRLDLMVNNAGIGVGGDVLELTVAHWDRVVDVNLRGVVHGVAAAYPIMVAQRGGHIVNVASLAGLVPSPLLAPYSATKYAVVGLSLSLRVEAAAHGVRVTAVCPGFVDTPILVKGGPDDLPKTRFAEHTRELALKVSGRLYSAEALAADVLAGIARNKAVVVAPRRARAVWLAQRVAPGLVERSNLRLVAWSRRLAFAGPAASQASADHAIGEPR
jgi:NAD(P)-dependent dehydrogenase (short-subunit alcohol dehydrogenase family)